MIAPLQRGNDDRSTGLRLPPYSFGQSQNRVAEQLAANEDKIVAELAAVQGHPADIGGYYRPDDTKAAAALRPSSTLNNIIGKI